MVVDTLLVLVSKGSQNGAKGLRSYPHVLVAAPWLYRFHLQLSSMLLISMDGVLYLASRRRTKRFRP